MAALPCCTEGTWKRSAAPRVDWPVYPRRAEHNTAAEGGIAYGPSRPVRTPSRLVSDRRDPKNHVRIGLARRAHGPQASKDGVVQPDEALTALVGPVFITHAAELERCGNRLKRLDTDRNADHQICSTRREAARLWRRRLGQGEDQQHEHHHQRHEQQQQDEFGPGFKRSCSHRRSIRISRKATTKSEKLAVSARHPFPGGNGTGGANFVVRVMLSVGAFARLTKPRTLAAVPLGGLLPHEDDAANGPCIARPL